ncbi:MAG: small multi-drug export protein [Clostridia bacterium]|nr:small multi-drug export protein [Clostridia bacterium]
MAETLWQALQGLDNLVKVFLLSMLPVTELRATIPLAVALEIPLEKAFIAAYLGNILPAPFILLLLEPLSRHWRFLANIVNWSYRRSARNRTQIEKYGPWGLLLFVAIPLPATGVWTGSLIASLLRLPFFTSLLAIAGGALVAAILVSLATIGIFKLASVLSWLAIAALILLLVIWCWLKGRR